MNRSFLHIVFFLAFTPLIGFGQLALNAEEHRFYADLAVKDAEHEHALPQLSKEDEADFWADQKSFEAQLLQANPVAYRIYLDAKGMAYRQHQLHCGENYCDHSEEFARQAAFYMVEGQLVEEMVYTTKGKLSAPKR